MKSVKRTVMVASILIVAFLLGSAVGEGEGKFPFTGVVTGNSVYVRSGPDTNYFPVSRLMRNNKVTVVGEEYGWYKIAPPEGSFSWVSKDYVEKKDGNKGQITGDRVSIRAGSYLSDRKSSIQLPAGKGMEVTILGEEGDWYKIVPPEGAFLWISASYVKPLAGEQSAPTTQPTAPVKPIPAAKTSDASSKTLQDLTTESASPPALPGVNQGVIEKKFVYKATTTFPAGDDGTDSYTQRIQALDREFLKLMKTPLHERTFDKIEAGFKEIAAQTENKAAARFAKDRLTMIDYQKQAQQGIESLSEIQESFEREVKTWKGPVLKDIRETNPETYRLQGSGVLRPSLVFEGPLMPKRFRLFDAEKGRTIAYVELAPGVEINLSQYLGRHVAVYGTATIDAKLGFKLIQADAFKILEEPSTITNSPSVIP